MDFVIVGAIIQHRAYYYLSQKTFGTFEIPGIFSITGVDISVAMDILSQQI